MHVATATLQWYACWERKPYEWNTSVVMEIVWPRYTSINIRTQRTKARTLSTKVHTQLFVRKYANGKKYICQQYVGKFSYAEVRMSVKISIQMSVCYGSEVEFFSLCLHTPWGPGGMIRGVRSFMATERQNLSSLFKIFLGSSWTNLVLAIRHFVPP